MGKRYTIDCNLKRLILKIMEGNRPMTQPLNSPMDFPHSARLDDVFDQLDNDIDNLFDLFTSRYNLTVLSFMERQIPQDIDREDESVYILNTRDNETKADIGFHIRVVSRKLVSCTVKSLLLVDLKKGSDMDGRLIVDTNNSIPECLSLGEVLQAINAIRENNEKISSFRK